MPRRQEKSPQASREAQTIDDTLPAPRTGGRLGYQRKADGFGERQRLARVRDQLVPGTGHTSGPSTDFMRDLSRTLSAVSTLMPSRPSTSRRTPLVPATARVRRPAAPRAYLLAQAAYGIDQLLRVKRVVDSPMPVELLLQFWGKPLDLLCGDDAKTDVRQPGRRSDEPRRLAAGRAQQKQRQPWGTLIVPQPSRAPHRRPRIHLLVAREHARATHPVPSRELLRSAKGRLS